MASLCDKCFVPGACCRRLPLSSSRGPFTVWEGDDPAEELRRFAGPNMPFLPLERRETYTNTAPGLEPRQYSEWWWTCPKVTPEGRCSIYEDRPETCRIYEPASDHLCVHFGGAEGGEPLV